MAELRAENGTWSAQQTAGQFRAIAWLRWRILVNGFRRKGGTGELIGRIIVYPIMAGFLIGPTIAAGFGAWTFATKGQLQRVGWILWAIFVLAQLISLNVGRSGTTFDPNELIRFPMKLRRFVVIRLFFGTLSPANILVLMTSAATWAGIIAARPRMWLYALLALAVFAVTNLFFNRMIFAWIDRWLSTRRAREIFTLLVFLLSMGFQYVNLTMNPAYNNRGSYGASQRRVMATVAFAKRVHPMLAFMPPELTLRALVAGEHGSVPTFVGGVLGTGLYGVLFLAVFAVRMRAEFRGEALSDVANAVGKEPPTRNVTSLQATVATSDIAGVYSTCATVMTMLQKELTYVRRNTGLFYSLIVPALMVLLFASRTSSRTNAHWVLPAAIAYTLFSVLPMSYNVFGLEGAGIQFYFLAPVRLRDVFLAKNLMNMFLATVEVVCVIGLLWYLRGRQSMEMLVLCLLWGIGALLVGMTIGNVRSVTAPMRVDFAKAATKQASPVNAFLSMGVLLGFAILGAALLFASYTLRIQWFLLPSFAVIAAGGVAVYIMGLRRVERILLDHRESLTGVLSKQR